MLFKQPLLLFCVVILTLSLCVLSAPRSARAITVETSAPSSGGFIEDGGDDQFDGGDLFVNGALYNAIVPGALPSFTVFPQTVGGIDVSGRLDLLTPNGTTSANTTDPGLDDFVYARHFYSFTNPGGAAANPVIRINYNLGSESDTVTHSTSSGDAVIGAGDFWAVTDDIVDGGPAGVDRDPALGLLAADGTGLIPSDFFQRVGPNQGANSNIPSPGFYDLEFVLPLDPGQTSSLMLFVVSRNETDTFPQTPSRAQTQADLLALLSNQDLIFSGLSDDQAASVVNFQPPDPGGNIQDGAVPEPVTTVLGLMGLAALGTATRRRGV